MTEAGHISELMDYLESLSEEMGNFERSVGIKQEIRPEIDDTLTDLETTRVMVETHTKQLQKEFSLSDGQQKKMMLMYLASPEDLRSQLISFLARYTKSDEYSNRLHIYAKRGQRNTKIT